MLIIYLNIYDIPSARSVKSTRR